MDSARLKEKLETIPDPRRPWGNLRHKPEDILVIGPAALLCNRKDFEDMEAFGQEREAELRTFLELPEGIPDESTFFRVFRRVNPKELSCCLGAWAAEARELRRTSTERSSISSADKSAWEFYLSIRGHRSLDVLFRKDAAQVSRGHRPENLNILMKTALPLLQAAPNPRPMGKKQMTGPKKRFTAAMNPDYMFTVFFRT